MDRPHSGNICCNRWNHFQTQLCCLIINANNFVISNFAVSCRKFFHAFNCLLSKSSKFAEPVMQQLVDSHCEPILIYNIASKAVLSKINSVWNLWCKWWAAASGAALYKQPSFAYLSFTLLCRRKYVLRMVCLSCWLPYMVYSLPHSETTAHLWHLWFLCAAYKCTYLLTYLRNLMTVTVCWQSVD